MSPNVCAVCGGADHPQPEDPLADPCVFVLRERVQELEDKVREFEKRLDPSLYESLEAQFNRLKSKLDGGSRPW